MKTFCSPHRSLFLTKHFVLTVNVGRCACVFKAAVEIIMFDIYIYFTT